MLNSLCLTSQETEKARAVREMEERLISSAFYNLSMQMHRTAVENRLSNVHASSSQVHSISQSISLRYLPDFSEKTLKTFLPRYLIYKYFSLQHGQSFLARQRQTIGNSSTSNNSRSGGTTSSGNTSQQQTPSNFIDY